MSCGNTVIVQCSDTVSIFTTGGITGTGESAATAITFAPDELSATQIQALATAIAADTTAGNTLRQYVSALNSFDVIGGTAFPLATSPAGASAGQYGQTHWEAYSDAIVVWQHDGTAWGLAATISMPRSSLDTVAGSGMAATIPAGTVGSEGAGSTHIELYDDALVGFSHDGTGWTQSFSHAIPQHEAGTALPATTAVPAGSTFLDTSTGRQWQLLDDAGTLTWFAINTIHTSQGVPHASPIVGDTWFNTVSLQLFQRVFDGATDVWIEISPTP